MARSKRFKKKNDQTSKTEKNSYPSVVGPDLFLLLQGRLFDDGPGTNKNGSSSCNQGGKNVSLILCGESHNDAIDVTRRSPPGKFEPTAGWIPVFDSSQPEEDNDIYTALPRALFVSAPRNPTSEPQESTSSSPPLSSTLQESSSSAQQQEQEQQQQPSHQVPSIENLALRYLHPVNGKRNKPTTLNRARELASAFVEKYEIEDDMFGRNLLLLWISTTNDQGRTEKGVAYLLEIETEAAIGDFGNNEVGDEEDSDDDDDEDFDDWVFFSSRPIEFDTPIQRENRLELPYLISLWMDDLMNVRNDDDSTVATVDAAIDDNAHDAEDGTNPIGATDRNNRNAIGTPRFARYVLFEYGDLDSVAHDLSKRRLGMTDANVTSREYDDIVETRKRILKEKNNVWTFDEWFDHVKVGTTDMGGTASSTADQTQSNGNGEVGTSDHAVHLVLEASIPPWEVELHRPRLTNEESAEYFRLHAAAECIRCLSEDSEASWEDEYDPSNDGIGSYVDFIYRRMMTQTMKDDAKNQSKEAFGIPMEQNTDDAVVDDNVQSSPDTNEIADLKIEHKMGKNDGNRWLHCIDTRDLGCESACHAESVKDHWYKLLSKEERGLLSNPNDVAKDACPINETGDAMKFLPAGKLNPEEIELERLKSEGLLVRDEDGDSLSEEEHDDDNLKFTFPSFESFFGLNGENMYYSPNVKLAYSPFLVHCVESLENWKDFFTALFFGGTIPEALEKLNFRSDSTRGSVHVRSPILQHWDPESNSYIWKERPNDECYVTSPFFPFAFHLMARGSSPPRTWSSQLFANLHGTDTNKIENHSPNSKCNVANSIKTWILDSIQRNMDDPKASDDKECGGEWFAAYLRAVHRDIYDDIDNSDVTVLLQKNYMKSLSGSRLKKHNIGKIRIPSAGDAFQKMLTQFEEEEGHNPTTNRLTPGVEVLAKILIDIWMSNLFDFSLLLKIVNVCANETRDNVVVVCYVGSAHARVANDFFCEKLGFKRKALIGKFNWEEDEVQTLDLPSSLWNLSELFR